MTLQKEVEVPFLKRCMKHLQKQLQTVEQLFTNLNGSQQDIPTETVMLNSIRDDDKCFLTERHAKTTVNKSFGLGDP